MNTADKDRTIYFQEWRVRILSYLNGIAELSLDDVKRNKIILPSIKSGPFSEDHSATDEIADLNRAHEKFHACMIEIVRLNNSGDNYEARMKFIELDHVIASCMTAFNRVDDRVRKLA